MICTKLSTPNFLKFSFINSNVFIEFPSFQEVVSCGSIANNLPLPFSLRAFATKHADSPRADPISTQISGRIARANPYSRYPPAPRPTQSLLHRSHEHLTTSSLTVATSVTPTNTNEKCILLKRTKLAVFHLNGSSRDLKLKCVRPGTI